MKLDKRVKENALIGHCFNAEELKKYISKECYFTDDLDDFSDLTNTLKGVLKAVAPDAEECYLVKYELNGQPAVLHYTFCLPAEFVEEKPEEKEEKKYRPYTIVEFQRIFKIGYPVRYRIKNQTDTEKFLILNGYERNNNKVYIYFGSMSYTLEQLFDDFEWQEYYPDDYKPFGVEE